MRRRWCALLDHPILRLELRRVRRRRWWPGRRFFLFYPALLGGALGCGLMMALSGSLGVQVAAVATSIPVVCLAGSVTWLLSLGLPWIAPALVAASVARERELGTFDLLRATLLTERSIVLGKLAGAFAQLGPFILMLALLTPFQLVWMVGSGLSNLSSYFIVDVVEPMLEPGWPWVWLILAGAAGLVRPWADLVFHSTLGMLASVLSRSAGLAIALTYGAILIARGSMWLTQMVLSSLGVFWLFDPIRISPERVMIMPALISLTVVLVELTGAALSIWAAIYWLRRM